MQRPLCEMPVSEEDAGKFAYDIIRSELGSIPYPGKPLSDDVGIRIVPITVRYPRVLSDVARDVPEKVRFMNFEDIGEIKIDVNRGELVYRPEYYEISNAINGNLGGVRTTVEMALVKVAANRFVKLPFSEHTHTPIVDILSWILINDTIEISKDVSSIAIDDKEKYINPMKEYLISKLRGFVLVASERIGITKMIFFGSMTTGKAHKDSDIDLIIVSHSFRRVSFWKRAIALYDYGDMDYPVEFIYFTPEEFEKKIKRVTIVSEAVKEGIEIT